MLVSQFSLSVTNEFSQTTWYSLCFLIAQSLTMLAMSAHCRLSEQQRHHRQYAYLTPMFVIMSEDILTTKYDFALRYIAVLCWLNGIDNDINLTPFQSPIPPKTSDSYASRWIINKVDPNYDAYRRQKWLIRSCIGHKYVCVNEVGCRILALKSWYRYFLPNTLVCRRRLVQRRGMKCYGIS